MSSTYLSSSIFIGAFDADKLVGFIKLTVDDTGTQAGIMHIVSLLQQRDKAPTNALVAQAVRSCADRHISHLVYSQFAYGKKSAEQSERFQGTQRLPKSGHPPVLRPSDSFGFGGPGDGTPTSID